MGIDQMMMMKKYLFQIMDSDFQQLVLRRKKYLLLIYLTLDLVQDQFQEKMSPFGGRDQEPRITPKPTSTNVNRPGGGGDGFDTSGER